MTDRLVIGQINGTVQGLQRKIIKVMIEHRAGAVMRTIRHRHVLRVAQCLLSRLKRKQADPSYGSCEKSRQEPCRHWGAL